MVDKKDLSKVKSGNKKIVHSQSYGSIFAIVLAVVTSSAGVFMGNFLRDMYKQTESSDQSIFLIEQPYWELGTVAFVEFISPKIVEKDEYVDIVIPPSLLKSFEISSFSNHKYSLGDNRNELIESANPSVMNPVSITLLNSQNVSPNFTSQLYYISHLKKDHDAFSFRIYWDGAKKKALLLDYLKDENIGQQTYRMILDFKVHKKHMVSHKHVGIVMLNAKMMVDDSVGIITAKINHLDPSAIPKTIMYGRGLKDWNSVHTSPKYIGKLLSERGGLIKGYDYIQNLNSILSNMYPRLMVFSTDLSTTGVLENITIKNDELIITFMQQNSSKKLLTFSDLNILIELDSDELVNKYLTKIKNNDEMMRKTPELTTKGKVKEKRKDKTKIGQRCSKYIKKNMINEWALTDKYFLENKKEIYYKVPTESETFAIRHYDDVHFYEKVSIEELSVKDSLALTMLLNDLSKKLIFSFKPLDVNADENKADLIILPVCFSTDEFGRDDLHSGQADDIVILMNICSRENSISRQLSIQLGIALGLVFQGNNYENTCPASIMNNLKSHQDIQLNELTDFDIDIINDIWRQRR